MTARPTSRRRSRRSSKNSVTSGTRTRPVRGAQHGHRRRRRAKSSRSPTPIAGRTRTGCIIWWAICWTAISRASAGQIFCRRTIPAVAAAVMVSPGGPAHVMLTDRQAEHIPGCNMAFYKWALDGGRRVRSRFSARRATTWTSAGGCNSAAAGSVSVPPGFVWHYRRSTVRGLSGPAEAATARPRRCWCAGIRNISTRFGGSIWQGRIYTASKFGIVDARAHHLPRRFRHGFFQTLYSVAAGGVLTFFTSLEYHVLVTLPLLVLSVPFHLAVAAGAHELLLSLGVCVAAAAQAELPQEQAAFVVAAAGGVAVFSAADRARLGALPGPVELARSPLAGRGNAGIARLARQPRAAATRRDIGPINAMDRMDFVQRILQRLDNRAGRTKPTRLERFRPGNSRQPLGAAATDHRGRGLRQGQTDDPLPPAHGVVAAGQGRVLRRARNSSCSSSVFWDTLVAMALVAAVDRAVLCLVSGAAKSAICKA